MFCADWALALGMWYGLALYHPPLVQRGDARLVVPAAAATGVGAMLVLHPFDFVRGSMGAKGSAGFFRTLPLSTVAFTTIAFGSYWTCRNERSKPSRAGWSLTSACLGAMAELPLDQAKLRMAGGLGRAGLLAVTRVPLGGMMLFAVDTAIVGDAM